VISDRWEGLDQLFAPEREIVLADDSDAVLRRLRASDAEAEAVGAAARARVLAEHTNARRAEQLERNLQDIAR
jgi:spore maturation protein CgeB